MIFKYTVFKFHNHINTVFCVSARGYADGDGVCDVFWLLVRYCQPAMDRLLRLQYTDQHDSDTKHSCKSTFYNNNNHNHNNINYTKTMFNNSREHSEYLNLQTKLWHFTRDNSFLQNTEF